MAAGGAVEPFWEVYAVHKDNKEVLFLLEQYRIGNLKAEDVESNKQAHTDSHDHFKGEPKR